MLEQAQLIARDLRPTPAPAPMSRVPVNTSPEVVRTSTLESAPEGLSQVSSVPQPIPPVIQKPVSVAESVAEVTSSERPSQPAEPAHVTMRYANSLLENSRFEEALQAFLELSHES
jgi:hypothetical protein